MRAASPDWRARVDKAAGFWYNTKVMRGTFRLVLVALLALACGLAFASDPVANESTAFKDSFPDAVSYPGVRLGDPVDLALSKHLDSLFPFANPLRRPDSSLAVPSGNWQESERQPFLDRVLPGVRILFVRWYPPGYEHSHTASAAYLGGKVYRLDVLNRLLLDAGFSLDSTEMPTIAKIAVLFATFGKSPADTGRLIPMSEPPVPTQGFPAITFLSVKRGEWKHPKFGYEARGVMLDCVVDGRRERYLLEFDGKHRLQPEALMTSSGNPVMLFYLTPYP